MQINSEFYRKNTISRLLTEKDLKNSIFKTASASGGFLTLVPFA
jgi:hypothetical protein